MPRIFRVENRSPLEASTFLPLFISLPEFAAGSKDHPVLADRNERLLPIAMETVFATACVRTCDATDSALCSVHARQRGV